ncbi:hypothetical protein DMN91_004950 [Ooceraea biroi]|uniref:Centriolar and ciliogenesis-associated protein HYLS1 C-terminal domain-containing protein n=1 Tax=Ooceraea biroi TaxID=2015173 RepID=A0A026WBC4_OOCBI|nr:uncharacterized protein LOC105281173 [Ooceraea biroi]EZA53392.1 hypothetical protein X777_06473 [Ooceraea biroi]RLU22672.1 hypothetical protein DMN91_004950 [Ooceraea biroi]
MSEIKDDPREVLVLLNSLGFVGITAAQLKAFMKDLKTYRKIKERERQQRREEIKAKIISKQQAVIREAQEHRDGDCSSTNVVSSEFLNSFNNESLVKVRIRCISKEDEEVRKHIRTAAAQSDDKPSAGHHKKDVTQVAESDRIHCRQHHLDDRCYPVSRSKTESRQNVPHSAKSSHLTEKYKHSLRVEEQIKPVTSVRDHSPNEPVTSSDTSRPRSKSVTSEPTGHVRTQSTLSARSSVNSAHKSFIRPWRLQPEAQRNVVNKKCDPVALYQKYQQEWKQISFPGEAKHSKVRWAVREKMLGVDPHPMPLTKKFASMPILKKK